jgi:hypothetical protein
MAALTSVGWRSACCSRWLAEDCQHKAEVAELVSSPRHTSTATTPAVAAVSSVAAAAAKAGHLSKTRIDLLLCLLKDIDKISSLFGVCIHVSKEEDNIITPGAPVVS